MDDGTRLYRLVIGEVYPLGIGFTTTPAADVKGIVVDSLNESREMAENQNSRIFSFKNFSIYLIDSVFKLCFMSHLLLSYLFYKRGAKFQLLL